MKLHKRLFLLEKETDFEFVEMKVRPSFKEIKK